MMKKLKFLAPVILSGMLLTACNGAGDIPLNYSGNPEDITINTPWVDYSEPVSGATFSDAEMSLTIKKGESHTYKPVLAPSGAKASGLNWESSDESIATISNEGVLNAVGTGDAIILVSSPKDAFDPIELEVSVVVPIENFSINDDNGQPLSKLDLDFNDLYRLNDVTFTPSDTTDREIEYEIADVTIADLTDDNEIITFEKAGSTTLKITSSVMDKVQVININVADRTVYANSVSISGDAEVEISQKISLSATIQPENVTHKGISWSVSNKDSSITEACASISSEGVLEGLKEGVVVVKATSEDGKASATKEISVYDVHATAINLNATSINLSNNDKNFQIFPTLTLDTTGRDEPSVKDLAYTSSNNLVATVNATGFVTAVGGGDAEITVSSAHYNISAKLDVHVDILATSISLIASPTSVMLGQEVTITANVVPSTSSTGTFNFDISGTATYEKVSQEKNVLVLLTKTSGDIVVTVSESASGKTSNPLTINVLEPAFESGKVYLVGSSNYSTGESKEGASWGASTRAYVFEKVEDIYNDEQVKVGEKFKALIKFAQNDEWLIRVGPNDETDYRKPTSQRGIYKNEGALADESMSIGSETGNIVVNNAGKYEIYFENYFDTEEGWFSVYVGHADLMFDKTNISMGVGALTVLKLSNWEGVDKPIVTSSDDTVALIKSYDAQGVIKIDALKAGEAVITANDNGNIVTCKIVVSEQIVGVNQTIYLNTNEMFDEGGVSMFVHSWNSEDKSDNTDTKITDKALCSDLTAQNLVYTVEIPGSHDSVCFTRGPLEATTLVWDEIYNQSEDIAIDEEHNMWTMTSYAKQENAKDLAKGFTSKYDANIKYTKTINEGFGLRFSDGTTYLGTHIDEKDYQGRDQYIITGVKFYKGTTFSLYNFANGASWIIDLDGASIGGQFAEYLDRGEYSYAVLKSFQADVYLKLKYNDDLVYIGDASPIEDPVIEPFAIDHDSLTLNVGDTATLVASNGIGTVSFVSSDSTVASVSKEGSTATISALAAGTANITVSDQGGNELVCAITVNEINYRSIYLNANGMFDTNDVAIFVHAWNDDGQTDYKMSLVSGQNIVYTAEINEAYEHVIFLRCAPGAESVIWGEGSNVYNQTGNMDLGNTNDMWTMNAWQNNSPVGTWSVFDSSTIYEIQTVTKIYLDLSEHPEWENDGVSIFVYCFSSTNNNIYPGAKMTKEGDYYVAEIENIQQYTSFIFMRGNADGSEIYNRTSKNQGTAIAASTDWAARPVFKITGSGYDYDDGNYIGSWVALP